MTIPALLTKEQLESAARDCAMLCDYAHEMGFHEMGYMPVEALLAHIAALEQRVADLCNRLNLSEKLQGRFPVDAVQPDPKEPR